MIELCMKCGRVRVLREASPVVEGEPTLGPTTGVAWLLPADVQKADGGLVSHMYCPRCGKAEMEKAEAWARRLEVDAAAAVNAEANHLRLFGPGEEVVS